MSLLGGWHIILIAAIAIALVVIVVVVVRGRRRSGDAPVENAGLLRFVSGLAAVAAALVAAATVFGVIAVLVGQPTAVDIPIYAHVPSLPSGVTDITGPTATITGGADHAELTVSGLSFGTRTLLALGQLAGGATFVAIALLVRRLARSAFADDSYRGVAARMLWASGAVLAVGSFAASILTQFGAWRAGVEALQISGWTATGAASDLISTGTDAASDLAVFNYPEPSFALTFEFTPLLIALALGCIAAVFREGERLRIRAEQAEADVAGLV